MASQTHDRIVSARPVRDVSSVTSGARQVASRMPTPSRMSALRRFWPDDLRNGSITPSASSTPGTFLEDVPVSDAWRGPVHAADGARNGRYADGRAVLRVPLSRLPL